MIWSHLILFNLFSVVELALEVKEGRDGLDSSFPLFQIWLFTGFFEQLLIAYVIVTFSKSANRAKTKEIWSCMMDYSVGKVRNNRESAQVWKEMIEDSRFKAYEQEDNVIKSGLYTYEEIDLHKSMLAGFIKCWTPSIEREILEQDLHYDQREVRFTTMNDQ